MTYQGVDTAAAITAAQAEKLTAEGVSFVGRYLAGRWALTSEEVSVLRSAGLAILLCWELDAEAMGRGATQGAYDAARAKSAAEALGVPSGTCIYFACDYNIPDRDLIQAEDYIKSAQTVLGAKYSAGAYGPLKLVEFLHDRGSCARLWQCVAWSAYFSEDAGVWQYQWQGSPDAVAMAEKIGAAVDLDTCEDLAAAGLWMPEAAGGASPAPAGTEEATGDSQAEAAPWYAEAMAWAEAQGLIRDGRPNDYVTRAELATVLFRIFGPEDSKDHSGLLD